MEGSKLLLLIQSAADDLKICLRLRPIVLYVIKRHQYAGAGVRWIIFGLCGRRLLVRRRAPGILRSAAITGSAGRLFWPQWLEQLAPVSGRVGQATDSQIAKQMLTIWHFFDFLGPVLNYELVDVADLANAAMDGHEALAFGPGAPFAASLALGGGERQRA